LTQNKTSVVHSFKSNLLNIFISILEYPKIIHFSDGEHARKQHVLHTFAFLQNAARRENKTFAQSFHPNFEGTNIQNIFPSLMRFLAKS